ncbi:MAG: PilZ domain-containing protein [Planctomycetota bacterium]|nr:MAG: PilZ domain-containing protein [Planctomycetota bacterium]
MLEASYRPREGRVEAGRATASIASGRRRLRADARPGADGDELVDLSPRGMKIRTAGAPPREGTLLTVELRHPSLPGALSLQGQVRWVEAGPAGCTVGIAFQQVRDTTAVALEQVVARELGHAVHAPTGQVGFLARGKSGGPTWVAYDRDRQRLGHVRAEAGALVVEAQGEVHRCADLGEVLERVFGQTALRVTPRLELDARGRPQG